MAYARWLCCFTPWLILVASQAAEPDHNLPTETRGSQKKRVPPPELARFFQPPDQYRSDFDCPQVAPIIPAPAHKSSSYWPSM